MADLIAYQNGNWTGATTWKGVATGAGSKQATIISSTAVTTTNVASANFTIGNGTIVEGLLLNCSGNASVGGSVIVGLYDGTTLQREVTVFASDLPSSQSWVFFKFATTLTAGTSATYNVRVRGTANSNATFWRDATAGNWARYLRTSTTATIAATDVTFICDELTAGGTKVDIEVTMNSTASTAYGECNIGQGGVLSYGTSASTNYILDLGGNLNVWGGGTLNIGTSTTRIPSTSTAVLEFTNSTNVQYGVEVLGGVVSIWGAIKNFTQTLLTADAASGQAILDVADATTDWAANDVLAIASTTRTASQTEKATISTVNSLFRVTLASNLTATHHGVAPYQGEVVNLTRNVKVRGTSQTLCAYIRVASGSFSADYAEFYWLGSSTANKRGIEANGTLALSSCSIYDLFATSALALQLPAAAFTSIGNCSIFYTSSASSFIVVPAASQTMSFTNNYVLATTSGTVAISDLGGTITGNRFAGCGVEFSETRATIGTINNNVQHSGTNGVNIGSVCFGTFQNFTTWRNSAAGIQCQGGGYTILGANSYHNGNNNINITSQLTAPVLFRSCTVNAGTGASLAATSPAINFQRGDNMVFDSCTFGNLQTHSVFLACNGSIQLQDATFRSCTINDTMTINNQSNLLATQEFTSAIKFDKFNNTSGSHRTYKRYGRTEADQSTFRTAAPSEALLPNNASNKLPSGRKKIQVSDGSTKTVSVYVRKSATYNGNQPRLLVRKNLIAGIAADTVLDTMSVGTGTWEQLSGTTAAVSDDCVLEVFVDCDGTAGTVNVDDWSVN